MTMGAQKKGFTLIELLIVVAIIAILAAIAIPNFLEARMRARVTKSVAEMKTVGDGLRAYIIDHNQFPIVSWNERWIIDYMKLERSRVKHMGNLLTSPIAYLSEIPYDYFNSHSHGWPARPGQKWSYLFSGSPMGGNPPASTPPIPNGFWMFESAGPNLIWDHTGTWTGGWFYDPSNGTVSHGQLCYLHTGEIAPGHTDRHH